MKYNKCIKNFLLALSSFLTVCENGAAQTTETIIKVDKKAAEALHTSPQIPSPSSASKPSEKTSLFNAENDKQAVVAKWDGGQLTVENVESIVKRRRPKPLAPFPGALFSEIPHESQKEAIRELAYELILLNEARQNNFHQLPEIKERLQAGKDKILAFSYYESVINPEIENIQENAAKIYYEKNKTTEFTVPQKNFFKILHVPVVDYVAAQQDETPRDIAKRVWGDEKQASKINIYPVPFYSRTNETALDDTLLSTPLLLNSKVQLPVKEDRITSGQQTVNNLINDLKKGTGISVITDKYDIEVSPEFYAPEETWWAEYQEAIKNLDENTTFSSVVKTPVGFDIIYLNRTEPSVVKPFDEVKDICIQNALVSDGETKNKIEEFRNNHLKNLLVQNKLTLNDSLLESPRFSESSFNQWVAKSETFSYTLEQFLKDLKTTGKDWGSLTAQERKDIALSNTSVIRYLTVQEAIKKGLDKQPEYREQLESLEIIEVVSAYLNKLRKDETSTATLAFQLQNYYNKNLNNYTKPAQVVYREITKRINLADSPANKTKQTEQAKAVLSEIRSRATSSDEFGNIAKKESEAISTRVYGGLVGPQADNAKGNLFKNQIDQLKPGEISQPFLHGSEMVIIRLEERTPPTPQPFDDVKKQVFADYTRNVLPKNEISRMKSILEKKNFELLF